MWLLENDQCIFHSGPDKCCKVQAREGPSGCAHNERQDDLNTTPSCHRRRSGGTWTEGSDRLSRVEITLALIGWLGAAGAQISRFQEASGLVKWTGTVCALCARACTCTCVSVFLACGVHLLLHVCVPTGTDQCECVRVLKNYGLSCQKGQTEVVVNQIMNLDFQIFIYLAETYMLWQWQVTGHVTGMPVNSQTAELWRWPPVCSCNYCIRRLIHKPITHLHPSPRGRYNVLHFIADLWIYACLYNRCLMYTIYCTSTCNSILIICSFQREIKRCFLRCNGQNRSGWNKGNKNQKSANEALSIIKLNIVR